MEGGTSLASDVDSRRQAKQQRVVRTTSDTGTAHRMDRSSDGAAAAFHRSGSPSSPGLTRVRYPGAAERRIVTPCRDGSVMYTRAEPA